MKIYFLRRMPSLEILNIFFKSKKAAKEYLKKVGAEHFEGIDLYYMDEFGFVGIAEPSFVEEN